MLFCPLLATAAISVSGLQAADQRPSEPAKPEPKRHAPFGHFWSLSQEKAITFPLPNSALFDKVAYEPGRLTVRMKAAPEQQGDRYTIEAYFDSNLALVYAGGSYQFMKPLIDSGRAVIVGLSTAKVLAYADVNFDADGAMTINFDSKLVGTGRMHYAVSRYLPYEFDLTDVCGGLGACIADVHVGQEFGEQRVLVHNLLYEVPDKRVGIFLPPGAEYGFPALGPRTKNVRKAKDMNGDGRYDYQYRPARRVGDTSIFMSVIGLDLGIQGSGKEDAFVLAWGRDYNFDLFIDPNELGGVAALYTWEDGNTTAWMEKHRDNEVYVHWMSVNPVTHRFKHGIGKVVRVTVSATTPESAAFGMFQYMNGDGTGVTLKVGGG